MHRKKGRLLLIKKNNYLFISGFRGALSRDYGYGRFDIKCSRHNFRLDSLNDF